MREFLSNLFLFVFGTAFFALIFFWLITDTNEVDRAIIDWKASVFGAP